MCECLLIIVYCRWVCMSLIHDAHKIRVLSLARQTRLQKRVVTPTQAYGNDDSECRGVGNFFTPEIISYCSCSWKQDPDVHCANLFRTVSLFPYAHRRSLFTILKTHSFVINVSLSSLRYYICNFPNNSFYRRGLNSVNNILIYTF